MVPEVSTPDYRSPSHHTSLTLNSQLCLGPPQPNPPPTGPPRHRPGSTWPKHLRPHLPPHTRDKGLRRPRPRRDKTAHAYTSKPGV
jgi:hypothetical protein